MEVVLKYFDDFSEEQIKQFEALGPLYKEWNEKINVISRKDIDHLYAKHILHSLAIVPICSFLPGMNIVDIGTGGGFPGIPLAIMYPEVNFLLVDSIGKKIKVVQAVADAIGLKNVTAIHSRVENIPGKDFDFAVSRAVAPLKTLWEWAKPIIKKGKSAELSNGLICLKGGDLNQELVDSNERPSLWEINEVFPNEGFDEKFIVWIGKK
ncbi:MAG TPA: 16S rRNA (guanine(527)-N(7))-methyltransferase RsmG [Edaphocola sp.]|nr:16S rRNA (guanine(527)-N(7))-methyltransferase RsmG [Edaphocola sp.]